MLSMLRFGAQCCFSQREPPTDVQLDAIIDRSRKEGEHIEGLSGKQHTAAEFDASASELNMRQLQGSPFPLS